MLKMENIKTRGRTFKGIVVSDKAQRTVTVEWNRRVYVPKYERYQKKRSKVKAHNPEEIDAKEGDEVIIKECRPISKTKKFIVVEVIK
ncbi:30S ribosomal protein S17 [archaeon]|jgi:small subunit ribosomal protein S17|nr:30S ribosomal protein S17 [archaeon]MBT4272472.1 30S ribosomal protein S17 [archaeon]MBT4460570.1 30S ribosomal protein S17 [archaeon]MBT4857840.1 30S ribosomal protein S17 [archaeon]MBT5423145.1 30S ribosomal protein S17 [archaeon]